MNEVLEKYVKSKLTKFYGKDIRYKRPDPNTELFYVSGEEQPLVFRTDGVRYKMEFTLGKTLSLPIPLAQAIESGLTFKSVTLLQELIYKLSKQYEQGLTYNARDFEVFRDTLTGAYLVKCLHWVSNAPVTFVFKHDGARDLLTKHLWNYVVRENSNYPQLNGIVSALTRKNARYELLYRVGG